MIENRPIEKHKDISRIDQESKRTYGWYARVRGGGKIYAKFFSDKMHGGSAFSLLAAIAWRDATEEKIGKPRTDKHLVTVSNTATGVVGVSFNKKLNRYVVTWISHQGKPGKSSVSIQKYGKEKAFQIACEKRKKKEAERLAS